MAKQKKAEAAILGVLDGLSFDVNFDESTFPDATSKIEAAEKKQQTMEKAITNTSNQNKLESSVLNLEETPKRNNSIKAGQLLYIPVNQCKPWGFANRPALEMGDIDELARSIKEDGQTVPVLARPIIGSSKDVKYEIIYGHRRWRACQLCNIDIFAIVLDISDKVAAKEQKKENEKRKDLSEYSEAFSYKKMLDEGMFSSQMELAATLGIPRQSLNNLLSYTKIPSVVLDAMKTPHLLSQRTAIKLSQISKNLSDNEINKLCELAPLIISKTIPYKEISSEMLHEPSLKKEHKEQVSKYNRKVVVNNKNVKLFTAGLNQNRVPSITFHKFVTDNHLYDDLVSLVSDYLKEKSES